MLTPAAPVHHVALLSAEARLRLLQRQQHVHGPHGGHLVDAVRDERSMHLPLARPRVGDLAEFGQLADCPRACHHF
eukprot:4017391-Pyramimonas_sp.AAC.1